MELSRLEKEQVRREVPPAGGSLERKGWRVSQALNPPGRAQGSPGAEVLFSATTVFRTLQGCSWSLTFLDVRGLLLTGHSAPWPCALPGTLLRKCRRFSVAVQ